MLDSYHIVVRKAIYFPYQTRQSNTVLKILRFCSMLTKFL